MSRIIRSTHPEVMRKTAARCRERGIHIPTFAQLRDPSLLPADVIAGLSALGLSDVNPLNLFRITWKNNLSTGLFGGVNFLEIPRVITGVKPHIIGLVGSAFPTGAHKVGAAFGCLVPRLVSGEFDPQGQKAVWPSTGNYCRGGAFDCALLGCTAVAVLPEGMSRERFEWLREIGAEIVATPGSESNVKEIYDKCRELRRDRANVILNQFEEPGNPLWHYNVTGPAVVEAFQALPIEGKRATAFVAATGSAGTIAAGDYLKTRYPQIKVVAAEALQCPTLLLNGFGSHRIEGIGDKHVPWVHNVRNTDCVAAIDDEDCMRVLRLLNEDAGRKYLGLCGIPTSTAAQLEILGISGIANLLAAIKTAKYFELDERDVVMTVFTDSVGLYRSRLEELRDQEGEYNVVQAAKDHEGPVLDQRVDYFKELSYYDRKAIHNLKYFTWVEQQGKTAGELNEQWEPEYWRGLFEDGVIEIDRLITEFNAEVERGR